MAWIRQGLKENTLRSYLNVITQDEKLLRCVHWCMFINFLTVLFVNQEEFFLTYCSIFSIKKNNSMRTSLMAFGCSFSGMFLYKFCETCGFDL